MTLLALALSHAICLPAAAELPPPDFREALVAAAEAEADALIYAERYDEALKFVRGFRDEVTDDGRLLYEEGLILRRKGEPEAALRMLRASVAADPTLAHAWYDLGELLLLLGEDHEEAKAALVKATEMSEEHPQGWVGPFRLAQLAGQEGDAAAFERWLKEALRRGFSFNTVVGDPVWRGFLTAPATGEIVRRMATVYGNEDVIKAWEAAGQ
jgi:tetratricopeptide (TPR) repeat protein